MGFWPWCSCCDETGRVSIARYSSTGELLWYRDSGALLAYQIVSAEYGVWQYDIYNAFLYSHDGELLRQVDLSPVYSGYSDPEIVLVYHHHLIDSDGSLVFLVTYLDDLDIYLGAVRVTSAGVASLVAGPELFSRSYLSIPPMRDSFFNGDVLVQCADSVDRAYSFSGGSFILVNTLVLPSFPTDTVDGIPIGRTSVSVGQQYLESVFPVRSWFSGGFTLSEKFYRLRLRGNNPDPSNDLVQGARIIWKFSEYDGTLIEEILYTSGQFLPETYIYLVNSNHDGMQVINAPLASAINTFIGFSAQHGDLSEFRRLTESSVFGAPHIAAVYRDESGDTFSMIKRYDSAVGSPRTLIAQYDPDSSTEAADYVSSFVIKTATDGPDRYPIVSDWTINPFFGQPPFLFDMGGGMVGGVFAPVIGEYPRSFFLYDVANLEMRFSRQSIAPDAAHYRPVMGPDNSIYFSVQSSVAQEGGYIYTEIAPPP